MILNWDRTHFDPVIMDLPTRASQIQKFWRNLPNRTNRKQLFAELLSSGLLNNADVERFNQRNSSNYVNTKTLRALLASSITPGNSGNSSGTGYSGTTASSGNSRSTPTRNALFMNFGWNVPGVANEEMMMDLLRVEVEGYLLELGFKQENMRQLTLTQLRDKLRKKLLDVVSKKIPKNLGFALTMKTHALARLVRKL